MLEIHHSGREPSIYDSGIANKISVSLKSVLYPTEHTTRNDIGGRDRTEAEKRKILTERQNHKQSDA